MHIKLLHGLVSINDSCLLQNTGILYSLRLMNIHKCLPCSIKLRNIYTYVSVISSFSLSCYYMHNPPTYFQHVHLDATCTNVDDADMCIMLEKGCNVYYLGVIYRQHNSESCKIIIKCTLS